MIKNYRYLGIISIIFVTVLLISNIVSSKILLLGPFTFDGGTILFPLSYIFGDILTEVYGYSVSRRVIWSGFAMSLLASLVILVIGALPASPEWGAQASYDQILGVTPRIIGASLIAYFFGEFSNSFILAKLKIFTRGKYLWVRTIGSTLVGEAFDTAIFILLAFGGSFSTELIITMIISNYIFKVGVEIFFTPLTYWLTGQLKAREKVDYYDYHTDFNPFRLHSEKSEGN